VSSILYGYLSVCLTALGAGHHQSLSRRRETAVAFFQAVGYGTGTLHVLQQCGAPTIRSFFSREE